MHDLSETKSNLKENRQPNERQLNFKIDGLKNHDILIKIVSFNFRQNSPNILCDKKDI